MALYIVPAYVNYSELIFGGGGFLPTGGKSRMKNMRGRGGMRGGRRGRGRGRGGRMGGGKMGGDHDDGDGYGDEMEVRVII